MKFLQTDTKRLTQIISRVSYRDLQRFTRYINDVAPGRIVITQLNSTKKTALVKYLVAQLSDLKNVQNIYKKLSRSEFSSYLYAKLLWERELDVEELDEEFKKKIGKAKTPKYGVNETALEGDLLFVTRFSIGESFYEDKFDKLSVKDELRGVLKFVYKVPDDFDLALVNEPEETEFNYSNEQGIFDFISTISSMLQNDLVAFGKTNEKPLAKSLNILKTSSRVEEFFSDKKLDTLATDMLTRSFSYYYWAEKKFKTTELETLKEFVEKKFNDSYYFFITRVLASHLKKIRYDHHYLREGVMFDIMEVLIKDLPQEGWVSINNIIKYCSYREYRIDLENDYKTDGYYVEGELNAKPFNLTAGEQYSMVFYEPIIKGLFFYLGALGLMELKYDAPLSPYAFVAKGKEYISPWDSLMYIKLTPLGEYVFGLSSSYEQKKITKKATSLKFDEYQAIITVEKGDTISLAKLEQFCDKYDENRLILSYAKIFKECKTKKALELKIDSFYKNIEANPPKVFKEFFAEIQKNANLLKRELQQVVIELGDNKKLLNLFMKNRKLQDLVIKAQGYRVIVLKQNIAKLTKIVKDNGFFVEF